MRRVLKFKASFQFLLFFFLGIGISCAQSWGPTNGPFGGTLTCLADNGSYLFAGTGQGVFGVGTFRSADNGDSWTAISGINGLYAMGITGPYLVASSEGGIKRSNNNGNSWTSANYGGQYLPVCFLSVGTSLFCGGFSGLFVSTDEGASWTDLNANFPGGVAPSIGALAVCGSYIYAGCSGGKKVMRSPDNGVSWETVYGGLTTAGTAAFNNLVVIGTDIYAGTAGRGVYHLVNNGTTWTREIAGLSTQALNSTSLIIKDSMIYCGGNTGLWRSGLSGTLSWTQVNNTERFGKLLVKGPDVFAAFSTKGAYRSVDNCLTWTPVNQGMKGLSTRKIIKGRGTEILAATYEGVIYKTTDQGANWVVAANINAGSDAFLLHDTTLFINEYRSFDNGVTWEINPLAANFGGPTYTYYLKGDTIFAGGSLDVGVYYSTDNGDNWTPVSGIISLSPSGGYPTVLSITGNGPYMFAGTTYGAFKSADNGLTWTSCYPALTKDIPVSCLASNGNFVFAGTSNYWEDPNLHASGVYRSADNGATWESVSTGLINLDIRTLVVNGNDLYAGTLGGIFKSSDNGLTWTDFNQGYPVAPKANSIYVEGNYMYADNWTVPSPVFRRTLTGSAPDQTSTITGLTAPCVGSVQVYSVINVPGVAYAWQFPADWVVSSGLTTNSVTVTVGATPGVVLITPSNGWGSGPTQFLNVTPAAMVTASVSVAPSDNPACIGTQVTFTASPAGGGAAPGYQWYKNAAAVATGPSYTYSPANGDVVYAEMTSSELCVNGSPASSNAVTMAVNPLIPASVSIAVSQNIVGAGTAVTFTATPVNGGTAPAYQWIKNNVAVAVGENYTYVPEDKDLVSVVMISNAPCVTGSPALSNAIRMVVNQHLDPFHIYPNPGNGLFNVLITQAAAERFVIRVYNSAGSLVYEKKDVLVNGPTTEQVDLRKFPSGTYLVKFISATNIAVRRVVSIR
ncbi:MAG: T9SS type A sorting domain-containing protein [Sphingobacteriales bacterium]|nr:T9SS type A sorting domain-containing protein [Sphingobacteriales bacterium]